MSFKTRDGKTHQSTVMMGENGLPVDTIATISGSYVFLEGLEALTYTAGGGTVTLPVGYDLTPVTTAKARYTGKYVLVTSDNRVYFIDKQSIDPINRTFQIYVTDKNLSHPASINLGAGWVVAEADIVNRIATTSAAKIDNVEFRDMHFQMELDGDPVTLLNASDEKINPATEEKQDDLITELGLVNDELDTHTIQLQQINDDLNAQFDETQVKQDEQTALLTSLDNKTNNDYGASTGAIRTSAQIGNTTGEADFGNGTTTAQTLRTSANITDESGVAYSTPNPLDVRVGDGVDTLEVNNDGSINSRSLGDTSVGNTTYDNLLAGVTWTGIGEDVSNYGTLSISIHSSHASADRGVEFQFADTDIESDYKTTDDYTYLGDGNYQTYTLGPVSKYFRIKYTNGDTDTTVLHIQTVYRDGYVKPSSHRVGDTINSENDAELTKSVISGENPAGNYENVGITDNAALKVKLDNVLAISSNSLFVEGVRDDISVCLNEEAGLEAIFDDGSVNGTATYDAVNGQALFSTGAAAGSTAIYRSKKKAVYEPGHQVTGEQSIEIPTLPTGDASIFWGYSDGNDAVGYILDANGLAILRKKNGVIEDKVYQIDWNRDKCLGGPRSEFRFNLTPQVLNPVNANVYRYTYEWLGTAPQKFYVKSPNDAYPLAHIIEYPNQSSTTTIRTPKLPLCIEIKNDTTVGGNLEVRSGCWRGGIHTNKTVMTAKTPDGDFADVRIQGVHSPNTTNAPLNGDDVFRGEWFDWGSGYLKLGVVVSSDVSGTLYVDYSNEAAPVNGVDTDITFAEEIPFDAANQITADYFIVQSRWVRVRYVNGPVAQSEFNLVTGFVTSDPGLEIKPLVEFPNNFTLGGSVRSVPTLKKSDGTGFQDWKVDDETENPEVTVRNLRDDILLRPLSEGIAQQFVVGLSPVRIDPVQVPNRRGTLIANNGPSNAAVGFDDTITFESGSFQIPASNFISVPFSNDKELWAVTGDTGGVESTLTRSGSTAVGTATDPTNALTSNDAYATIDANAETVEVSGYTAGTINDLVSVKLGVEAKKQAGQTQTVAYIDTVTGSTGDTGVVTTSANVTAVDNQLYIAAVTRENPDANVVGVSGLGLTWTQVASITNGTERVIDVYRAIGIVSGDSVVQASFNQTAQNSHIAVSRYSGADPSSPIQAFSTNTGTGTAVSTAGINGTDKGMAYMAVAKNNSAFTPGAGYTEASDETTPTGSDRDGLATEYKALTATGLETPTGTLSTTIAWAAVSLTIRPAEAVDPEITLSYEYSAVPGATSAIATISSTADTNYLVDVTSDRAWVAADIVNVEVFVTGSNVGAAAALVDYVFIEIVDTTGATTRFSVMQAGEETI